MRVPGGCIIREGGDVLGDVAMHGWNTQGQIRQITSHQPSYATGLLFLVVVLVMPWEPEKCVRQPRATTVSSLSHPAQHPTITHTFQEL